MSKHAWMALHVSTFAFYAVMVGHIIFDLATTGELSRSTSTAGRFSAGDVVLLLSAFGLTALSALRAAWVQEMGE
jgi:hypothetical protein